MPNLMANATNFPRRINMYVPAMAYSADVNYNGETRVNFGAPLAAVTTSILNVGTMTGITSTDLSGVAVLPEAYGRCIQVAASGANATVITVNGWDYLGQPIAEALTLNGATPVIGNKAFKWFSNVTFTAAATTLSIGTGVKLGLPYKAIRVVYEIANGALVAAGTLQAPSVVDPATTTTTDPRGLYTTTTTMNGANIISAAFNMLNDVNTANNGGLHGIRQAAA
jgi:hypothetical protein